MNFKVNKKALIYLVFNILIILPLFFMLSNDCNLYISIIVILQIFFSVFEIRKNGIPYLSFQVLFIVISSIFHFGQTFLLALNRYDLFRYTNIDLAGNLEIYNKANIFALLIQAFVVFGMLLINNNILKINKENLIKKNKEDDLKIIYKIGIILLSISIIPNFLYYYSQIKLISLGGVYNGIREAVNYGPLMLLKLFYQPAIFMLLIGSKNNIKKARLIMFFAISCEMFFMLSGNRAQQILTIITLIFIYYRLIKKLSLFNIVIYLVLGYFLIIFLYFISAYRNFNIFDLTLFKERLIETLKGGPIFDLLAQLGSNLNVVVLAFTSIPSFNYYNLGITYLISWLAIYPNTGGILGNIPNMYVFLNYLNTNLPLGGSYIAELYFNFGWIGLIFAIFIGIFLGYVGKKIELYILKGEWLKLSIIMVLFSKLLWWIRDYFYCWIYATFWCFIVISLLYKFIKKRSYIKGV
ncbi:O-antigen polysaccharide polymerase Wzy [Clostridium perfringens]